MSYILKVSDYTNNRELTNTVWEGGMGEKGLDVGFTKKEEGSILYAVRFPFSEEKLMEEIKSMELKESYGTPEIVSYYQNPNGATAALQSGNYQKSVSE